MSDTEVAAVLAEALHQRIIDNDLYGMAVEHVDQNDEAEWLLHALTAAGYAVVKVPEGVVVEHGTRLIVCMWSDGHEWHGVPPQRANSSLYAIEPPNEAP